MWHNVISSRTQNPLSLRNELITVELLIIKKAHDYNILSFQAHPSTSFHFDVLVLMYNRYIRCTALYDVVQVSNTHFTLYILL